MKSFFSFYNNLKFVIKHLYFWWLWLHSTQLEQKWENTLKWILTTIRATAS